VKKIFSNKLFLFSFSLSVEMSVSLQIHQVENSREKRNISHLMPREKQKLILSFFPS